MNKRFLTVFVVLVALLSVASLTVAQSTPAEDPKDNACYAGGAWEGKCDWPTDAEDEWAWNCGWYYARIIDGRIGAAQYPADCGEQVSITCYENTPTVLCIASDLTYTLNIFNVTVISVGTITEYSLDLFETERCIADALTLFGFADITEAVDNEIYPGLINLASLFPELVAVYGNVGLCVYARVPLG
jgi:hypothetical protein